MKNSLMLVGAMMISSFIFAQNDAAAPERHRGNRGDDRESMKTVLNLDDKQVSSIEEINKKYHEKGREAHKDLAKDLNDQRQGEISKVLTPEQNKKWTDYKKERAARFEKARDERVKKQLNLSDDQLKKLKSDLTPEQYNRLAFGGGRHRGPHGKRGDHNRK